MSEQKETLGQVIGRLWTDSIAYVALLVSAGLSLAGNVVDTYRVRGLETDALDIWLAVTWPGLVVLMVHVFVSSRWIGLSRWMQTLRWLGCLSIMAVAMRASWLHLNDLLVSRGQAVDIAVAGPLAIDFLAIMSTALILAGRKRGHVRPVRLADLDTAMDNFLARPVSAPDTTDKPIYRATEADVRESQEAFAGGVSDMSSESIWDRLDKTLDTGQAAASRWSHTDMSEAPSLPVPVSPAPARSAVLDKIPAEAVSLIRAWESADLTERPKPTEMDRLVSAHLGCSAKTVYRWRAALVYGDR